MTKPLLIMFPKKVNKLKALEFIDEYFPAGREMFECGYRVYGEEGPFYIRERDAHCFSYGNMYSFSDLLHNGAGFNVIYYDCDRILVGDLQ